MASEQPPFKPGAGKKSAKKKSSSPAVGKAVVPGASSATKSATAGKTSKPAVKAKAGTKKK